VSVVFSPEAEGSVATSIEISSNAVMNPVIMLPLSGIGSGRLAGPGVDIKINGADAPSPISSRAYVTPTLSVSAEDYDGVQAEFWIKADTAFGEFWYVEGSGWVPSSNPRTARVEPISDIDSLALGSGKFPKGVYLIEFGVDDNVDGEFNPSWTDSVSFSVY
jgi:hypothetical protein